jgi:hypothetical protein
MAVGEGKVPVLESVGGALRSVRENLSLTVILALVSAVLTTAFAMATTLVATTFPPLGLIATLATTIVSAAIYAAFVSAGLKGAAGLGGRLPGEALRLWAAMAIVFVFFMIVFFVLLIPGVIVIITTFGAEHLSDLQAAGSDNAAVMAVMMDYMADNPLPLLLVCLVYMLIWLALSSRLFLAAPATLDAARILTFETWAWTKGNTLRISGARVMLLFPAYVLVFALTLLAGKAIGVDVFNPASTTTFAAENPWMFALFNGFSVFVSTALYRSLEAGLSTYLYKGLRPQGKAADVF